MLKLNEALPTMYSPPSGATVNVPQIGAGDSTIGYEKLEPPSVDRMNTRSPHGFEARLQLA